MIRLVCADQDCAHPTDACFDDGLHPGEDWCQFCGDWCMIDGDGCADYKRWTQSRRNPSGAGSPGPPSPSQTDSPAPPASSPQTP